MDVLIITNGNADEIAALLAKLQQQNHLAAGTCRTTVGTCDGVYHQEGSSHYVGSLAPFSGSLANVSH